MALAQTVFKNHRISLKIRYRHFHNAMFSSIALLPHGLPAIAPSNGLHACSPASTELAAPRSRRCEGTTLAIRHGKAVALQAGSDQT